VSRKGEETRNRIQEVALRLFTEQGYDKASLREIAEKLGVTKAALYYYFKSKEEILQSIDEDMHESVKELIEWAQRQPRTTESRKAILTRLAEFVSTRWRPFIQFAQANQTQLRRIRRSERTPDDFFGVFSLLREPGESPVAAFKSTLAVIAVLLAHVPAAFMTDIGGDLNEIAIEVAMELIAR
jgi:AcrR family transcriptional regulator